MEGEAAAHAVTRKAFADARKSVTATTDARKAFIAIADAAAFSAGQAFVVARRSAAAAALAARHAFAAARKTVAVASKAGAKRALWTKPNA